MGINSRVRTQSLDDRVILYRLFDLSGNLLYVGITNDFKRRLNHHKNSKTWFKHVARTDTSESFEHHGLAGMRERQVIENESPLYNKRHVPYTTRYVNDLSSYCVSPLERRAIEVEIGIKCRNVFESVDIEEKSPAQVHAACLAAIRKLFNDKWSKEDQNSISRRQYD